MAGLRHLTVFAAVLAALFCAGFADGATIYCPQDKTPFNGRCDGTSGADTIYGTSGTNEIHGNGGTDTIWGKQGDDWLYGESGNDGIFGGTGSDLLSGFTGTDVLVGDDDSVKDILNCGDGSGDEGYFGVFDFHAGGCERRF